MKTLFRSVVALAGLVVLLCGVYPCVVTVLGQLLFRSQALGGLVVRQGVVVGAHLIGQGFSKPQYFHGRPSAAGNGYDAANSGGSNLGPASKKLFDRVQGEVARLRLENGTAPDAKVPTDLVTASASGLDPHISVAAARFQTARVAKARAVEAADIWRAVESRVEGPELGFLGEPRINVLVLNLELDRRFPVHPQERNR